jgi:hypothetical protein
MQFPRIYKHLSATIPSMIGEGEPILQARSYRPSTMVRQRSSWWTILAPCGPAKVVITCFSHHSSGTRAPRGDAGPSRRIRGGARGDSRLRQVTGALAIACVGGARRDREGRRWPLAGEGGGAALCGRKSEGGDQGGASHGSDTDRGSE